MLTHKYTQFKIMNMTELEQVILNKIAKLVYEGKLSNDFLVQNIEQSGDFLNLKTISDYAKDNQISYNGAKNFRNKVILFNTKFIIDNE